MIAARILIVEDEAVPAAILDQVLRSKGHTVVGVAGSSEEAIQLAAGCMPDLILMDIDIEGQLDGIATAGALRERGLSMPVVFLTAYADPETVARARDEEPFGYLLKPVSEPLIGVTIEMALYKHRMEQEREKLRRELEAAQAELRRSNQDLEQFAYVASHDLQEPLRTIASALQVVERRSKGRLDADGEKFLGMAADGALRLQTLIRDLLSFSRIGTVGKKTERVEMAGPLGLAIEDLKVAIAEKQADIAIGPLPVVSGNPVLLKQLFQNLLSNAIKFCKAEAPRVRVSAAREGGEWIFSVADNGIGIEPRYWDQIFVMFKRLHGRDEYAGTGIGLAICKRIVEHHGGRIWVTSEAGMGTTFHFALPVVPE